MYLMTWGNVFGSQSTGTASSEYLSPYTHTVHLKYKRYDENVSHQLPALVGRSRKVLGDEEGGRG